MSYSNYIKLVDTANRYPSNASVSSFDTNIEIGVTILLHRPLTDTGLTMKEYADQVMAKQAAVLSRWEFSNYFSVSQEAVDQIIEFAKYFDLTVTESNLDGAWVKLQAPISQFNQAFGITIEKITVDDRECYGHSSNISIPEQLLAVIEHVLGLDSLDKLGKISNIQPVSADGFSAETQPDANPAIAALTPVKVAAAYKFPNALGNNQCVGIVSFNGGYTKSNLDLTFAQVGLATPQVIDYGPNITNIDSGANFENVIDIYVVGCVVPKAKIVMYFSGSPYVNLHWADIFNTAIHDTVNSPSVISCSWSFPESLAPPSVISAVNSIFSQAVVLGITICCSIGDYGAFSDIAHDNQVIRFPAATPYVLAVGATSLILNRDGTVYSETAWQQTGGGVSKIYDTPDWQQGLQYTTYGPNGVVGSPAYLVNRGIPDVTANGDISSGYIVFYDTLSNKDVEGLAGGTSVSTPLIAGLIAQLNQISGKSVGFVNQLFYNNPSAFVDITSGNNAYTYPGPNLTTINSSSIGYSASVGWDAVSGLGRPDGTALQNIFLTKPVVGNISVNVKQNSATIITPVLAPNVNKINIVTGPSHGTATIIVNTLQILYTPNPGYYGNDNLLFTVSAYSKESDPALVTIKVGSLAPVASTVTTIVQPNTIDNPIYPIATNAWDTVQAISSSSTRGTALARGAILYYTPATNFVGTDTFQYTVSGAAGTSNLADVIVTVPTPKPLQAFNIARTVFYNSLNNIIPPNVSDSLYSTIVVPPKSLHSGTVVVYNNQIFYSTPNNYVGNDTFNYTVIGPGSESTATVSITILSSASNRLAFNLSQFVRENSQNNLISLGSANFSGVPSVASSATHGVTAVINNRIYYTPNVNYIGFDQFTYSITNSYGASNTATFNISVNSVDYTPISFESTATVIQNSSNNVLTPLTVNTVTGIILNTRPIFGSAVALTSTIVYTPVSGFIGIDYLTYSVFNSAGVSTPSRFYVTVTEINIPYANNINTSVAYNSLSNPISPSVINPFNAVAIVSTALHGVATVSNTTIYYTPTLGYSGTDTFYYSASNLKGTSNPARVSVTVSPSTGMSIYPPSGNLPRGSTGTAYAPVTFYGINGTAPFSTTLSSGTLPTGMTLTNNILSGIPSENTARLYNISVTLRDSSSPTQLVTTGTYVLDISKTANVLITTSSFNILESSSSNLVSTIYGSYKTSRPVVVGQSITALGWDNVYDDMLRCFIHQNGTGTNMGFIRPTVGSYISLGQRDAMLDLDRAMNSTYYQAHPSQILLDTDNIATRPVVSTSTKTYSVIYTWPNDDFARYFFNLGGYITGAIYNPDTGATISTAFTLSNYLNSIVPRVSSTSVLSNAGTGTVFIDNQSGAPGNAVLVSFKMEPSTSSPATQMTFTATDYYSTDITGGILAPRPFVNFFNIVVASPVAPVTVTGNTTATILLQLTNNNEFLPISMIPDDLSFQSSSQMPLTVTYAVTTSTPIVIAPGTTNTLPIKLQNWTRVGGIYNINFKLMAKFTDIDGNRILINTVTVPVQVTVAFGISVVPNQLTTTITRPTDFNFAVYGYGGTNIMNTPSLIGNNFKTVSSSFDTPTSDTAPAVYRIKLNFDPLYVVNGAYSAGTLIATSSVNNWANVTETSSTSVALNLTINVVDKNLGSWISGQSPDNAIAGFDYSIFNGVRTLTMGFGSQPALNAGGRPMYSDNSLASLGRPAYTTSTSFIRISDATWGVFLNTYGVVGAQITDVPGGLGIKQLSAGGPTSGSSRFFVRYSGNFQWTFSSAVRGSLSIDGDTVVNNQATDKQSSVQGTKSLTAGWHTAVWSGAGSGATSAVAATIKYLDGVNANYVVWSTLDDCYHTSWFEITRLTVADNGNSSRSTLLPNIYPLSNSIIPSYSSYFKDASISGTAGMFTVANNGYGDLIINFNEPVTSNASVSTTLQHTTDLKYFYSEVSNRYSNVGTLINGNLTYQFLGFNRDGSLITSLVAAPRQPPQILPIPPSSGFNWWPIIIAGVTGYYSPEINAFLGLT